MHNSGPRCARSVRLLRFLASVMAFAIATGPLQSQSNRSLNLISTGAWRLHARIPLGSDALVLNPSRRVVEILATVEAPEFEGWSVTAQHNRPIVTDVAGKPVEALPQSVIFRVTASSRDRLLAMEPMGFECSKDVGEFLLDLHFEVQVFRGMEMRELHPRRAWLIGVPADEPADERIYRVSFNFDDVRPSDRVVLLVRDGNGARLTKFHLEFL